MKATLVAVALVALPASVFAAPSERDVLAHYSALAHAVYEDSLSAARTLQGAVNRLVADPSEENLEKARKAWVAARVPYQQSEVYRFGNAIVDDWEGKVNAWPLDEGLIDETATDLLVDDLEWMTAQWGPGGEAREGLVGGDANQGLATILTGMGSLSYGELAGERMQLGLLLHDPEEEHDCFSDNTHASHYYDALGIRNIYLGEYERIDGSVVRGPSVSNLVAAASADADAALRQGLDATMTAMGEIVAAAEGGEAYDQQIGEGNPAGNARVQAAIDALTAQTSAIERAVAVLDLAAIDFEGSDSLDDPEAVFE